MPNAINPLVYRPYTHDPSPYDPPAPRLVLAARQYIAEQLPRLLEQCPDLRTAQWLGQFVKSELSQLGINDGPINRFIDDAVRQRGEQLGMEGRVELPPWLEE